MEGQSKSPSKGSEANGFVSEAQRFISALAAELAGLPDCDGEIVQIVNQHVVVEKQSRSAVDEALAAIEALATKRAAKSIQDAAQDNAQ